jgi:hypothetical protein
MTAQFLKISMAAGLIVAASAPARAESSGWAGAPAAYSSGQYPNGQYPGAVANPRRVGYDNGYRDGLIRGEQAVRSRRPLDIQRERDYRLAQAGYDRRDGDPNRYRDNYRAGFAEGYRDAYNRGMVGTSGRREGRGYGGGYGREAVSVAFRNGERDGYAKGLDDFTHRRSADFARQGWYRSGDRGYNGGYGARDLYRDDYRRGFEEGYQRAFSGRR